jgi:hypothetical protein
MNRQAEGDEEILTFDIPDEALERAASAEQKAFTWANSTSPGTGMTAAGHSSVQRARILWTRQDCADAGADLRRYCPLLAWRQPARYPSVNTSTPLKTT